MVTEGGLPSENKFQLLYKTRLANLLLPRCSPWLLTGHTSSYTEGGSMSGERTVQNPCKLKCPPGGIVSSSLSLLFPCFLFPFIQEGQKPAVFSASSYWSSIHINNFSGRIMYTRACSNVPHSKSNWLLRTHVELLLSHHHLKRRKADPILLPACYSF